MRIIRLPVNDLDFCVAFNEGLEALFDCRAHGEYHRIRTPYLYPDGDNIDVFCKSQGEVTLVTDLGETTRWLRMQTVAPRRSPRQKTLIEDACLTHGVEFYRGMLLARCRPGDQPAAGPEAGFELLRTNERFRAMAKVAG